ncbi:hypothetical protein IC582_025801 [Cucumis melo]
MIAEDLSKQVVLPPPKFIALLFRTDSSSLYFLIHSLAVNVAYNHRVLVIDGKERVLVSKFIHYPQSILEGIYLMLLFLHWPSLLLMERWQNS